MYLYQATHIIYSYFTIIVDITIRFTGTKRISVKQESITIFILKISSVIDLHTHTIIHTSSILGDKIYLVRSTLL